MNTQTKITFSEYTKKLGGYVGMLYYRYCNLCIKADPTSLLSTSVISEDGLEKIEDVCVVIPGDDDFTLELHVVDNDKLIPLEKGLFREHPEFKVQVFREEDKQEASIPDDLGKQLYILLTMPEVDEDRHDLLENATKALYGEAETNIEQNNVKYTQRLLILAKDEEPKEVDMLKDNIRQVYNMHKDKITELRDQKLQDINEAYEHYQEIHGGDAQENIDDNNEYELGQTLLM